VAVAVGGRLIRAGRDRVVRARRATDRVDCRDLEDDIATGISLINYSVRYSRPSDHLWFLFSLSCMR